MLKIISVIFVVQISPMCTIDTRKTFKVGYTSAVPTLDWTKLHGGNDNQHSVVTTQAETALSYPGGRQGMTYWADHRGQVWMFGGWGFEGSAARTQPDFLNDLWTYDSLRDKWKCLQNCGRLFTTQDSPGARQLAASCGLRATGFLIFGGGGKHDTVLNDTWIYEISKAKWLLLTPENHEYPKGRSDPARWCKHDGLVMFGGIDSQTKCLSDMWKFNFSGLVWERLPQSSNTKYENGSDMFPCARHGASTWYTSPNKFYMFGGQNEVGFLSDLWLYNISQNAWTLIHGNDDINKPAVLGTLGISAEDVVPSASSHHATWLDKNYNLLMFGGETSTVLPDMWQFSTDRSQWTWLGKANLPINKNSKGTSNFPGARSMTMSWPCKNVMYMFGGIGLSSQNKSALLNELYILTEDNVSFFFSTNDQWIHRMPASTVFIIILSTFSGIALTIGAGFFIKKTLEYPRHSTGEFDVRYSPLAQETSLDM